MYICGMKSFNFEKLGKDLYNKRGRDKSLVDVSKEIKVNTVTLSQIERGIGKSYSVPVVLAITEFIGSKLDDYVV